MNKLSKYRYSSNAPIPDETKKLYMLAGICALIVIIGLVLCLTLQDGCSPADDIPVVEQGDITGESEWEDFGDITSIGDIIADDALMSEFEVTVTGADGTYTRSEGTEEATLTISGQNSESFAFELKLGQSSAAGRAYFNGARSALYENADGALRFSFEAEGVLVTTEGTVSELSAPADGIYISGEAADTTTASTDTTSTTTTPANSTVYDLDIIKSENTKNALSGMMGSQQYSMVRDLLDAQGGYGIIYDTGDNSKEKEQRRFNYDPQTDGIMYYAFESGTGRETVIICTGDGKVYAGVCDGSEYRYYSNDPARASAADAPGAIHTYARVKGLDLH